MTNEPSATKKVIVDPKRFDNTVANTRDIALALSEFIEGIRQGHLQYFEHFLNNHYANHYHIGESNGKSWLDYTMLLRGFTRECFVFCDDGSALLMRESPLLDPNLARKFAIAKNERPLHEIICHPWDRTGISDAYAKKEEEYNELIREIKELAKKQADADKDKPVEERRVLRLQDDLSDTICSDDEIVVPRFGVNEKTRFLFGKDVAERLGSALDLVFSTRDFPYKIYFRLRNGGYKPKKNEVFQCYFEGLSWRTLSISPKSFKMRDLWIHSSPMKAKEHNYYE